MHYILTPMHTHIDFGFGVTGDAFKDAADQLDSSLPERRGMFNERLPINYLRRHAVELHLKSAIVIIHRSLGLPYGQHNPNGEPRALVDGDWVLFTNLHSVKKLWTYVKSLFRSNHAFFDSIKGVNWAIPPELDAWIDAIEDQDPRSTFFRYPNLRERDLDIAKSVMTEGEPEHIRERLSSRPEEKQFVLLMKNEAGEITRGYYYEGDSLTEFSESLTKCADLLHGIHAALRALVCGGA